VRVECNELLEGGKQYHAWLGEKGEAWREATKDVRAGV
jgi:hypothetical protein